MDETDARLLDRLKDAAVIAIEDLGPTIERDQRRIRSVCFELDVSAGRVRSAHAWLDYRASVARILGDMPPLPAGQRV